MTKGTIVCGAGVVFALTLLLPANVSARSSFSRGGLHSAHGHTYSPYGYGPVATYAPGGYAPPVVVLPAQAAPAAAPVPHCVHSRETVTVPAEAGGERKVTITRC